MKKTNVTKILKIMLILLVFCLIFSTKVQASEATVSANNCNVGENFTVTVSIPQDVSGYDIGGVTVTYSDGSSQSSKRAVKVNMDLSWPGNYSVSFPGKSAGNATISVNGIILSNSSYAVVNTVSNLETTVTITDPNAGAPTSDSTSRDSTGGSQAPSAPVVLNFKDTNETMYTDRRVNVRQNYGTDSGIIQTLAAGTQVTRTGISNGNKDGYSWSRISYNGITGYLITGALTDEAPAAPEETPPETPTEEQKTEETTPEVVQTTENDEAKIAELKEKFGAIPEVGVNIMPFFFLGTCASCSVLIVYVKKRM